ncbi:response regulator [Alkalilimnicola sp. S0819]|uniref:response regulator n=1 Tax=Alkalilimnicola sp. S0819 TaxID=2613922 RepID=UPI001261424C|nr:response regulator transcription factor [Alkalilimnicola sp. S0819]KAB7624071.1 response regulator transcription factor [Alkalilimnicola sp. S0819]MPQ16321.1 response regulator [Alkalilimnicola sp. S0819]
MKTNDKDRPSCRVLLLEDDGPVRERLARILNDWPGGELLAACATLAQAMEHLAEPVVDLLITDLQLPDGHGVQAIHRLREVNPAAEAMVISVLADDETVVEVIEAGATGYLLKDADSLELIEAIEDLLAGCSPISPSIARVIVKRISKPRQAPPAAPVVTLTPRETDILWGIAKGFTYAELAEQLGISRQTVPVHVKNIYRKLEAGNRSEAVFEASRLGLIRL